MRNPRLARAVLLLLALPCPAATWNGAGDGWSWLNPDNWEAGSLPLAGETVWIRPAAGGGWIEIGGVAGGAPLNLVIDSPINLNLMLNPEARVTAVTTLDPGAHFVGGNAPQAGSRWEVAPGGSLSLGNLPADAVLEKWGGGLLTLGAAATGAGGLRVVGREGSLVIEVDQPMALAGASLEALGASVSFSGEVSRVARLVIGDGQFSPMSGGRLTADEVVISRQGSLDLSYLPGITTDVLRIVSGGVRPAASLEAGRIILSDATLELGESSLGGVLEVSRGWIDGGVITGQLTLDAAAGMSGWTGNGSFAPGGKLSWKPGGAALYVMGQLAFEEGSLVEIASVDWASPFWDEAREFAFLDSWGAGQVTGLPGLTGSGVAGEGTWVMGSDGAGGLRLAWTPEAVPVPEASALGWALALGALGAASRVSGRSRRAPPG